MAKMGCENDVKREIRKLFKAHVCYDRASPAGPRGKIGVPDRHACCRGWFIGVEAKFGNNWLTKPQSDDLKEIAAAGGIALVIHERNLDVLQWVLERIAFNAPVNQWWASLPHNMDPDYLEPKK